MRGADTTVNTALRNDIHFNGLEGVLVSAQAHLNIIGGAGLAAVAPNFIRYNGRSGVALTSGAHRNSIGSNQIYGNKRAGILFWDAATQHNSVTLAVIFGNSGASGDGIAQANGAVKNFWSRISTYNNEGLGIDLEAVSGFNTVTAPYLTITQISVASGAVTISGKATASAINEKSVTVEIYRSANDPSGHGEGQTFVVSG